MDHYFGDRPEHHPVPATLQQVDTPIGQPCLECEESIQAGDKGYIVPLIDRNGGAMRPVHTECGLLGIIGHMYGVCSCVPSTRTTREDAKELWERMLSNPMPPS